MLETPKDLNTNCKASLYKGLVKLYKSLHTSKIFKYVTMDNQQETKVIFYIISRILRDYAWDIVYITMKI